jgi:integrase
MLAGAEVRKSLDMRDWQKAQDYVREWEAREAEPKATSEPATILTSKEKYLADAVARCLNESTIYKYRLLFKQLDSFAAKRGLRYLQELDLETLDAFRAEWKDGPRSSLKKLERLRAFFRFCERRKWVDGNPAADLRAPKVQNRPTMPFTQPEMVKILVAFDKYSKRAGVANAQRLKAFVLLLRYSGMRIGDAVACGVERIDGDRCSCTRKRPECPFTVSSPRSSCANSKQHRNRAMGISSGLGNPSSTARSGSGRGGFRISSGWQR